MSIRRTLLKNPVIRRNFQKAISQSQEEYTTFELLPEQLQKIGRTISFAGYVLLILTFLDYAFIIIPPRLFNPAWELNVISHLIESMWAPTLGFLLIFFRMPQQQIRHRDLRKLSLVSRLVLLMAIIYFLLVPLIISDTVRINRDRHNQFKSLVTQQQTKSSEIKQQLSNLSDEQVTKIFAKSPVVLPDDSGEVMREKLLNKFKLEQSNIRSQAAKINQQNNRNAIKKSIKYGIGAILSGLLFINIWENTKWTRNNLNS